MTAGATNSKFHRLFGKGLAVALEATLEVGSGELDFDPEQIGGKPNQELLFRNGDCWRAYFPAVSDGGIQEGNGAVIVRFIPWFTGPNVLFYRICLRARPLYGNTFRWLRFGRFGEEAPFGFSPAKPFINLDFFSQSQEFNPLYVKVAGDNEEFIYFKVEAEWSEDGPALKLTRVNEQEAPLYLQAAKP